MASTPDLITKVAEVRCRREYGFAMVELSSRLHSINDAFAKANSQGYGAESRSHHLNHAASGRAEAAFWPIADVYFRLECLLQTRPLRSRLE